MIREFVIGTAYFLLFLDLGLGYITYEYKDSNMTNYEIVNYYFFQLYFNIFATVLTIVRNKFSKNVIIFVILICLVIYEILLIIYIGEVLINNMFIYILIKSFCVSYLTLEISNRLNC